MQDYTMYRLQAFLLSSALLVAPVSMTAAFAQSEAGSQAPATSAHAITHPAASPGETHMSSTEIVPHAKKRSAKTRTTRKLSERKSSTQRQNPPGAQPGMGSGMGKVSGTAAGN
jgi:uncharacterized protein YcnI